MMATHTMDMEEEQEEEEEKRGRRRRRRREEEGGGEERSNREGVGKQFLKVGGMRNVGKTGEVRDGDPSRATRRNRRPAKETEEKMGSKRLSASSYRLDCLHKKY